MEKNIKKDVLESILELDGNKREFIVALIHLIAAHKECFPEIDTDWDAVCRLLIPEIEKDVPKNT